MTKLSDTHKENEQIDPQQVYKVPVCGHQFYRNAVIPADLRCKGLDKQNYQRNDPTQYVCCVQSSDDVQELSAAGTLQRDAAVPDRLEPFPLQHHKSHTQKSRQRNEIAVLHHLPFFESFQRHLYRHTADEDHHRGIPESAGNGKGRPVWLVSLDDVGTGKPCEHHHNAAQRHP